MNADQIDSYDILQLRLEILRLRDQALGAEARNDLLHHHIAALQGCVQERDALIAQQEILINEQKLHLAERDAHIADLHANNVRLHEDLARPVVIRILRRLRKK